MRLGPDPPLSCGLGIALEHWTGSARWSARTSSARPRTEAELALGLPQGRAPALRPLADRLDRRLDHHRLDTPSPCTASPGLIWLVKDAVMPNAAGRTHRIALGGVHRLRTGPRPVLARPILPGRRTDARHPRRCCASATIAYALGIRPHDGRDGRKIFTLRYSTASSRRMVPRACATLSSSEGGPVRVVRPRQQGAGSPGWCWRRNGWRCSCEHVRRGGHMAGYRDRIAYKARTGILLPPLADLFPRRMPRPPRGPASGTCRRWTPKARPALPSQADPARARAQPGADPVEVRRGDTRSRWTDG